MWGNMSPYGRDARFLRAAGGVMSAGWKTGIKEGYLLYLVAPIMENTCGGISLSAVHRP